MADGTHRDFRYRGPGQFQGPQCPWADHESVVIRCHHRTAKHRHHHQHRSRGCQYRHDLWQVDQRVGSTSVKNRWFVAEEQPDTGDREYCYHPVPPEVSQVP
jgi:hypothetical protein